MATAALISLLTVVVGAPQLRQYEPTRTEALLQLAAILAIGTLYWWAVAAPIAKGVHGFSKLVRVVRGLGPVLVFFVLATLFRTEFQNIDL